MSFHHHINRRSVMGGMAALFAVPAALAQPDLSRPMEPTIADKGSPFYRFQRFNLWSRDGKRQYRVTLGIPNRPAPAAGYPAFYMLDGNAALGVLDEALLTELDRTGPPLLVAIGYETPLRFDTQARAFDYTPPTSPDGETWESQERGRRGGGADLFLDLIAQEIKPRVAKLAPVDAKAQSFWGHSYGGLLVLHSLFTRPADFQTYIAASPSIWWQDGFILSEEKRFQGAAVRLLITRGDAETRSRAADPARTPPPGRADFPADAAPKLARRLQAFPSMHVEFMEFPGLSHGQALGASLPPALRFALTRS